MSEARAGQLSLAGGAREDGVSMFYLFAVLLRARRTLIAFAIGGAVLGVALALFRPLTYTTNFSLVAQAQRNSAAALSGLAGQLGLSLGALGGETQPPQFYRDLLSTREVLGPIVRDSVPGLEGGPRIPLTEFLGVRGNDTGLVHMKAMRKLSSSVITAVIDARTAVISVRVRTRSRQVSLQIARQLIDGLNQFNLVSRQSQAREERRFTEGRLADAREALRRAEDVLLSFSRTNRDLSNSVEGTLQRNRLQREVDLQQQIVLSLAQQYEENRIREVRDTPVLTVVEAPILAPIRDSRHGVLIVLLVFTGTVALGVAVVFGRDVLTRSKGRDPGLDLLTEELKSVRPSRQTALS